MRMRELAAVAGLVVLGAGVGVRCSAAESPKPGGPRICVVNLPRVYKSYKKTEDIMIKLEATREQILGERKGLAESVKRLEQEIQLLNKNSAERKEKEALLTQQQAELRAFNTVKKSQIQKRSLAYMEGIYRDMRDEIAGLAKEQGYDLVVQVMDPDLGKSANLVDLNVKISERVVLYHRAELEITDLVVKSLNAKYAQAKAGRETKEAAKDSKTGAEK